MENNKLIAEFLEFEKVKFLNGCYTFIIPDYLSHGEYKNLTLEDNKEVVAWDVENLIFHKDWNWLMKVVEKINTIDEDRFTVQIFSMDTYIYDSKDRNFIIKTELTYNPDELIKSVYNTCVKFIKWYNSHLCANCGRFDDVVGTHSITICEECALNNTSYG